MTNLRVLLLSGYDAVSHRLWRERLKACFPDWEWTTLAQPPRHFAWRLRSNAMYWASEEADVLSNSYDLLIATSMVDLSTLRGLSPNLAYIPTVVYFHENQFAYPVGRQRSDNIEPTLVPIYSALCCDAIVFNSHFNRTSFIDGVQSLSRKLPEPFPEVLSEKLERSSVVPVPLPNWPGGEKCPASSETLEIVWNHRWEYDKGPDLLLATIQHCWQRKIPVRFHIVGQQFREQPAQFAEVKQLIGEFAEHFGWQMGEFGYVESLDQYQELLLKADVVLSTAQHDFQGLAVQEACLLGCSPLAPNDLAYPEYLPETCLYDVKESNPSTAALVSEKISELTKKKQKGEGLPVPNLNDYSMDVVKRKLAALSQELLQEMTGIN